MCQMNIMFDFWKNNSNSLPKFSSTSKTEQFFVQTDHGRLSSGGRACIPVGLTKTWNGLVNWTKCVWKVEERRKNPGQPRTMLTTAYGQSDPLPHGTVEVLLFVIYQYLDAITQIQLESNRTVKQNRTVITLIEQLGRLQTLSTKSAVFYCKSWTHALSPMLTDGLY